MVLGAGGVPLVEPERIQTCQDLSLPDADQWAAGAAITLIIIPFYTPSFVRISNFKQQHSAKSKASIRRNKIVWPLFSYRTKLER